MKNDLKQKQTLIHILYQISEIDGEKDNEEIRFINEISQRLQLSDSEISEITSNNQFKLSLPKEENDRIYFFFHALQMIEMDKKVTVSEIDIIKKIGFKLGLPPLLVNDLIDLYISYLGEFIPPEKIPSILKNI